MDSTFFPATDSGRQRRATLRLIEPELQLRLPAYLLGVTLGFAVLASLHSWYAYDGLLANVPVREDGYREILDSQTSDFLWVSFSMLVGYGVVMMAVCIAYLRRVVGPIVAFRRQIALLRRGDYAARNNIRRGDPFEDLSDDLNDLAKALEVRREMKLLNH